MYNTFTNFIEDVSIEDIDIEEILDDLYRYLSNNPEEIAAPIKLKENSTNFLLKFIDFGADKSITELAKNIGVNQSTIARQIAKISSKFYARWRLEKNYKKLGLHSYLLLIRIPKNNKNLLDNLSDDILKISYVQQFYEGYNDCFYYQYSVFHCPHIISIRLENKLNLLIKKDMIHSYEIKQIKDRIFKTAIINKKFIPTIDNFKKLILGEIPVSKVILYNNDKQKNQYKETFDERDKDLFKFISIIISKSTSKYSLYGAHIEQLLEFFIENDLDPNNQPECASFLNRLQKKAYERNLFEYRFNISLSGTASSNLFIVYIKSEFNDPNSQILIEKLSCFGWTVFIKTLEGFFLSLLGPDYNHPLANLIVKIISDFNFEYEAFSVKNKKFRFIDYSKLYDFKSQKFIPK